MEILTFSASPRMMWVNDIKRMLNPSYWLLGALMERLSYDETVYTIKNSMRPTGKMKPYSGQSIDMIVIMGVAYSPGNLSSSFKKGYPRHQRVFDIAEHAFSAYQKYKPLVVELTVDVRRWYKEATDCFGFEPDIVITEQDMQWQQVGYLVSNKLFERNRLAKERQFVFCGSAKSRHKKMVDYMTHLPIPGIIDGGGWDKWLDDLPNIELRGFQKYYRSVSKMLSGQYGLSLHEPMGEDAGWVTAKFFENLGCRLVNFTDKDYDKNELLLPHNHPLRVFGGQDMAEKILAKPYEYWITLQDKLIDKRWLDYEGFYYQPFLRRLKSIHADG